MLQSNLTLQDVRVVLTSPKSPGNIGSAARAAENFEVLTCAASSTSASLIISVILSNALPLHRYLICRWWTLDVTHVMAKHTWCSCNPFPLYNLLSVGSSIVLGPDMMQQLMLVSPVANTLVMLQLACGSPLMDTMTIVPTLQEALADTSGLPITPGQFTSHGAVHTPCTADKMHIDSYIAAGLWYV